MSPSTRGAHIHVGRSFVRVTVGEYATAEILEFGMTAEIMAASDGFGPNRRTRFRVSQSSVAGRRDPATARRRAEIYLVAAEVAETISDIVASDPFDPDDVAEAFRAGFTDAGYAAWVTP